MTNPFDLPGLASGRFVSNASGVQLDVFGGSSGYRVLYADPPWRFDTYSDKGRGRSPDHVERQEALPLLEIDEEVADEPKHYPTMTMPELLALPIGALAARDSVLYMWGTTSMMRQAIELGEAWGFKHATARIWVKTRVDGFDPALTLDQNFPMGTGYIARGNPEPLHIFTRGKPKFKTPVRALIVSPRLREHSRKPDIVRRDIERQCDGPYLELFARTAPRGWDAWGSEVGKFEPTEPLLTSIDYRNFTPAGSTEGLRRIIALAKMKP